VITARPLAAAMLLFSTSSVTLAAERLRFWNLTATAITELRLAPAGTDKWGPNQCENDSEKSVEPDERLTITAIEPGRYDVRLRDKQGHTCIVRTVEILSGRPYAFSISDKDLTLRTVSGEDVETNRFFAVILIRLNSISSELCDETTAADVLSNRVESELSCRPGWQDVLARPVLANQVAGRLMSRRSAAASGILAKGSGDRDIIRIPQPSASADFAEPP
jgi:hypothetical protein